MFARRSKILERKATNFRTLSNKTSKSKRELYKQEGTIYYHWPFCKNICIYCSFNKYATSNKRFEGDLLSKLGPSLLKETETLLELSGISSVKSIYFGGGTPSLAPVETISSLIHYVKAHSQVKEDAEISLECNPSSEMHDLGKYADIGVNRVSVGLQTLNDEVLHQLGRDHSSSEGLHLLQKAQEVFGKANVSIDLLFRKPGDSVKSWMTELEKVMEYDPYHLSLYELTPEKGTQLSRDIRAGRLVLPTTDDTAVMYEEAVTFLELCGYERYEVSNFAKKSSSSKSKHNQAYWSGSQYVGVGPGAHSRFFPVGETNREARVQALDPRIWIELVEKQGHATQKRQRQSHLELLTELISTSMRTTRGVEQERWSIFETKYSLREILGNACSLQPLFKNGFIEWDSNNLRTTRKGLNVVDSVIPKILAEVYKSYS